MLFRHYKGFDVGIRHFLKIKLKCRCSRRAPTFFLLFVERSLRMTIDEASTRYNIPLDILREYESWGLCDAVKKVMGAWQYDDQDIERLSMIMTLHDIGFLNDEVESYMRLLLKGESTEAQRLDMLNKRRSATLDEIHFREMQLNRMDYLRHKIRESSGIK